MEQYLRFFSNQSTFMANYNRELKIGINTRKKEKVKNVAKFAERIRKFQKEAEAVLRKI